MYLTTEVVEYLVKNKYFTLLLLLLQNKVWIKATKFEKP
jgi:hypothetical protein